MRWLSPFIVTIGVFMLVLGGCSDERTGPLVVADPLAIEVDYDYRIPAGTGNRFDAGEPIDILPARLEVQVGEVFRISNEDDRDHLVGPFYVGAGEVLTQRFSTPGRFTGLCTVHPSGRFVLEVSE